MQALSLLLHYPSSTVTATTRVADPNLYLRIRIHLDKDPDPAPHKSDANLRPQIYRSYRALFISLQTSPRPSTAPFKLLELLTFDFNENPEPVFHSNAYPATLNKADPCGSGSATLPTTGLRSADQ